MDEPKTIQATNQLNYYLSCSHYLLLCVVFAILKYASQLLRNEFT